MFGRFVSMQREKCAGKSKLSFVYGAVWDIAA
jgi:hypothetical protein